MVVEPGARVATDGVVRQGRSTLDLSAITGESVPVEVEAGAEVFAASINGGGVLEVAVTARTVDSSLARVVHIVEEAQERKGQSQRVAERAARPLVPASMIVATGIAAVGSIAGDPKVWISRALVVLVVAAPCAFAISVPVTVFAAVGAASRMGSSTAPASSVPSLFATTSAPRHPPSSTASAASVCGTWPCSPATTGPQRQRSAGPPGLTRSTPSCSPRTRSESSASSAPTAGWPWSGTASTTPPHLVLSGLIIGILSPLAGFGVLGLAVVVATHELAEILVVANGVRAGRRPTKAAPVTDASAPNVPQPEHHVQTADL